MVMEIELRVTVQCEEKGCWSEFVYEPDHVTGSEDRLYEKAAEEAEKAGWDCQNQNVVQDFCPDHKK